MTQYQHGYRFGMTYARNHGLRALLSCIRRDERNPYRTDENVAFIAGEVDAALALVQGATS